MNKMEIREHGSSDGPVFVVAFETGHSYKVPKPVADAIAALQRDSEALEVAKAEIDDWKGALRSILIDWGSCKPHHFIGYEYCRHNYLPDYCPVKAAWVKLNADRKIQERGQ